MSPDAKAKLPCGKWMRTVQLAKTKTEIHTQKFNTIGAYAFDMREYFHYYNR